MELCRKITGLEKKDGFWLVRTDCADMKLVFVTDEIVRVRVAFDRELAEESYVLMTTAWADRLDPLFEGRRTRLRPVEPKLSEGEGMLRFESAALRLELDRDPLCLRLFDAAGTELYSTLSGIPFTNA